MPQVCSDLIALWSSVHASRPSDLWEIFQLDVSCHELWTANACPLHELQHSCSDQATDSRHFHVSGKILIVVKGCNRQQICLHHGLCSSIEQESRYEHSDGHWLLLHLQCKTWFKARVLDGCNVLPLLTKTSSMRVKDRSHGAYVPCGVRYTRYIADASTKLLRGDSCITCRL